MTTPVALFGPAWCTVIVNVTLVPRFGVGLLTVLVTCRSADGLALIIAEPALLPVFGSNWLPAVFVAVFVMLPGVSTVTVICSVALLPLFRAPTVHTPVPCTYVPCDGSDETYSTPPGKASVIATPVALFGPLLVAVIVYVTFSPTFGDALSTLLLTAMSAEGLTGTVVVPVQRPAAGQVGSPPPLAVALLFAFAALAATFTFNVSCVLPPAAIVLVNVQLSTVVPVQLQLTPLALASVMPVGSVSATVMLPDVGP